MPDCWTTTTLTSEREVLCVLTDLRGKSWLSRGQSNRYGKLLPSIDRKLREKLGRAQKLALERQSIDLFRSAARFLTAGEEGARNDDVVALMVLRHYGVPTRLLDWSSSPHVAAYFACDGDDTKDGEIWSFDRRHYESEGKQQWKRWPETTRDGSGDACQFVAGLTAFTSKEPPNWFICAFYNRGLPRQNAQDAAYSMTARFGRDHADAIATLLGDESRYHLYVVSAKLKLELRRVLRENHGIWRGSLFPDSAGAADTARAIFQGSASNQTLQPTSRAKRPSRPARG